MIRSYETSVKTCPIFLQCLVRLVVLWSTWLETATPTQESLTMTVTTMNMWYVTSAPPQTIKTKRMSLVYFHRCKTIFCFPLLVLPSFLFLVLLRPALPQLEDLEVTVADHIQKVLKPNFGAAWEEVGDEFEKEETFALASVRTLDGTQAARNLGWNHKCTKFKDTEVAFTNNSQAGLRHEVSWLSVHIFCCCCK